MHHSSVGGGGKSGFEERGPHLKGTRAVFAVVAQRKPAADRADGLEASGSPRAVCSFRPGSSMLHAAFPAWVPCYTPRFRPGSSMLHAAFPAWVLLATRRFSGLGPPCYTPRFRPGSGQGPPCYTLCFRSGFDLAGYIALPIWVWTGSCFVHRELPAWFSLGHSGYTACFWSGSRRGPFVHGALPA